MRCDNCNASVDPKIGLAANDRVTGGQYWCLDCCTAAGLRMPRAVSFDGNEIRERWLAAKKAKAQARLEAFLASRKEAA